MGCCLYHQALFVAVAGTPWVAGAAPADFPAPRWWEHGGRNIRGVWPKCALGEGLSEAGQMRGLPAFMAMLDRLHADNVSTLQMVVYDSGDGYNADDLWCGLAGSNYSRPLTNIGSEVDWHTFIDGAHSRNMTVTSFWNAAYFWTGSPYFKQAEADIREHGLGALPEDSPARWFRWSARRSRHTKPADDKPNTNWCSDWVWDPDVNASYYGVWGCQPTTDFASEKWRAEMKRILTRWIVDLKLDGFMFDAPDAELGAGIDGADHSRYTPALIRESISDVIRNVSGGRAAAFAEIYSDPPLTRDLGFDGEFADDKLCPRHSGKYCLPNVRSSAIGQAVLTANASLLESAMHGPGAVDDLAAQVYRAPGTPFRASYLKNLPVSVSWLPGSTATNGSGVFAEDLNCTLGAGASYAPPDLATPVTLAECFSRCRAEPRCDAVRVDWFTIPMNWTEMKVGCGLRGGVSLRECTVQAPVYASAHTVRYSTFALDAPNRSQLVVALTALSGYLPVVRNSGNDWTTSAAPWPGQGGDLLPRLLVAMQGEASLGLTALRMRVPVLSSPSLPSTEEDAHYGLLRYDALGTGQATLIAINLNGTRGTVPLDLRGLPPQLLGQQPRNLLCTDCPPPPPLANQTLLAVSGYGVSALTGLQLPLWQTQGHLYNCSATYITNNPSTVAPPAQVPLIACLISCLHDAKCDAIEVEWVQRHSWPRPASMAWYGNLVLCGLRGGVNLSSCAKDSVALPSHSTVTMARGH